MTRTGSDWAPTFTGKQYWPTRPRVEDVCIDDIAHGLSYLCRYSGQSSKFYSVAEHSVHVSHMVPPEFALDGLLHDASEAYCSDVTRPLKKVCPDYKTVEALNMAVIRTKFRLSPREPACVKQADTDVLLNEFLALFPPFPHAEWPWKGTLNTSIKIVGWSPREAEIFFLERFRELIVENKHYR